MNNISRNQKREAKKAKKASGVVKQLANNTKNVEAALKRIAAPILSTNETLQKYSEEPEMHGRFQSFYSNALAPKLSMKLRMYLHESDVCLRDLSEIVRLQAAYTSQPSFENFIRFTDQVDVANVIARTSFGYFDKGTKSPCDVMKLFDWILEQHQSLRAKSVSHIGGVNLLRVFMEKIANTFLRFTVDNWIFERLEARERQYDSLIEKRLIDAETTSKNMSSMRDSTLRSVL